jgi:hypothetical protein
VVVVLLARSLDSEKEISKKKKKNHVRQEEPLRRVTVEINIISPSIALQVGFYLFLAALIREQVQCQVLAGEGTSETLLQDRFCPLVPGQPASLLPDRVIFRSFFFSFFFFFFFFPAQLTLVISPSARSLQGSALSGI